MPYHLLPVPFSIAGILVYLVARNRNDLKKVAVVQPLLTALSIAVHRFRRPLKFSVGPILYAGGQLLVALSCAYFQAAGRPHRRVKGVGYVLLIGIATSRLLVAQNA